MPPPAAAAFDADSRPTLERILVVDDHEDTANGLARALKALGADVRVAFDGLRAIQVALDFVPQVVILDLVMPGVDGYRVAQLIRSQRPLKETCLLALTGWSQEDARRRAKDAGFDDFMKKPLDVRALKEFLGRLFRSAGELPPTPPAA